MSFDQRTRYTFDPTESQIAEGDVSPYGTANSHANCVPASFTAALTAAGYPDIDPEQIIVDEYGINWRGGTDFAPSIAWIEAHVANPPAFSNTGFDFAAAEAAGNAGRLIVIAGWIVGATVTFTDGLTAARTGGFSHASLLIAHNPDDSFVIWNTWLGKVQTYTRSTIASSLYQMSVMTPNTFGPGQGVIDMTLSEKRAWVRLAYVSGLGREVESQISLDNWAGQILDDGSNTEAIITQILDSPEGASHLAAVRAAAANPGKAGPPGPAGPPGQSGANPDPAAVAAQLKVVVQ